MATRKKYKIVLSEKYVSKSENGKEWFQFPINISGQLVAIQTIIPLDPYTEPDMEQVREEAYEDGYKTAKVQCNIQAEKDLREVGERHYQKGLSDAWEAARKVTQVRKYGGYGDCLGDVFGRTDTLWDVFDYSASEAIEKIRQYEQRQEEIKVGDEVSLKSGSKGFVTRMVMLSDEQKSAYVVWSDGYVGNYSLDVLQKTGKHYSDVIEVMRKMGEAE